MNLQPVFSELLVGSLRRWSERKIDECILSISVPVSQVDPLITLPLIAEKHQFRFLWDLSPGLCISAGGHCQSLDLYGPKRFENAQRFSDEIFRRLIDTSPSPEFTASRILFSFSFFDQIKNNEKSIDDKFSLQAVLPRWQLTAKHGSTWLRLNSVAQNQTDVREAIEKLWAIREKINRSPIRIDSDLKEKFLVDKLSNDWKSQYRDALAKGIELINTGDLDKLVLATRQFLFLRKPLDPLKLLSRLRVQQTNSCRFLWQKNNDESFFGASPERLISLNKNYLIIDALAGTAKKNDDGKELLSSSKDLREHHFVVKSILEQLLRNGVQASHHSQPKLMTQGHLIHLHTLIQAYVKDKSPLSLVEVLHPTPAVAGLPLSKSLSWLRALEPFDRQTYASPVGWIDKNQNSEFRVAIRYGHVRGRKLELFAGAGLVKGSTVEGEMQEVALKFEVLRNQLNLDKVNCSNDR
tara:strand:- start:569 stop:1969 length:1401 start_codon:yes stop_codon:yes gene_type:complete